MDEQIHTFRFPSALIKPQLDEMTSDLVKRLLEKLDEKEKEKQKLRRARQRLQRGELEKDW